MTNFTSATVSWEANRLDIFVRGTNGGVFHKAWDGTQWLPSKTEWEDLGGDITDSPAAVSWEANRLDIFVRGTNGGVFHKAWDGTQWLPSKTEWEDLGGQILGSPTVVSWEPNRLDIFAVGTNLELFHKAWDGTQWLPSKTEWEDLGGQINVAIVAPAVPDTVTLDSGSITSGLSIGGSAKLVLAHGGETTFTGQMHNGGILGIKYLLTLIALTPSGTAYTVQHEGRTAGTLTPGSEFDTWTQTGINDKMRDNWQEASKATLSWTLHANDTLTPPLGEALEEALQEALKAAGQAAVKAVIALL